MKPLKLIAIALMIFTVVFTLSGCSSYGKNSVPPMEKGTTTLPPSTTLPPITQGVNITILLRSGDCMPTIYPATSSCSVDEYDIPTTVIIKRPVNPNVYDNQKVVVATIDNVVGKTNIELPVGRYNLYVMFQGREYCTLSGGQVGQYCEFQVTQNKVTDYKLTINTATD